MSSFDFTARNRKTGKVVEGVALDGYFGQHTYGYQTKDSKLTMQAGIFNKRYELLTNEDDEQAAAEVLDQVQQREFIVTDSCMWEQNKQQGVFHPHAIEVVDTETGQVRLIESGARIKFVSGKISSSRTQDDYNNQ